MASLRTDESWDPLFDAQPLYDSLFCTCDRTGFCPVHGTYQPAVVDPEILDSCGVHPTGGRRVIRKRLGGD